MIQFKTVEESPGPGVETLQIPNTNIIVSHDGTTPDLEEIIGSLGVLEAAADSEFNFQADMLMLKDLFARAKNEYLGFQNSDAVTLKEKVHIALVILMSQLLKLKREEKDIIALSISIFQFKTQIKSTVRDPDFLQVLPSIIPEKIQFEETLNTALDRKLEENNINQITAKLNTVDTKVDQAINRADNRFDEVIRTIEDPTGMLHRVLPNQQWTFWRVAAVLAIAGLLMSGFHLAADFYSFFTS